MKDYVKEAYEVCQDTDFKNEYRKEWDLMDQGFQDGYDDGKEEGIEEGIKQGIKQGIEQGIEQGIKQNLYKIVKKMLEKNTSIKYIMEITGLSKKEIEAYQNK